MKKSTDKAAKSKSAPVKKAIAKVVKKVTAAVTKPAAPKAVKKAPAAKPAVAKAPVVSPAKASVTIAKASSLTKAPLVKTTAAKQAVTVISASVDVGYGNTLFIRGEGADGLSWDVGVALDCVNDIWTLSLPAKKSVTYKFLINDVSWSGGDDYITAAGAKVTQYPSF